MSDHRQGPPVSWRSTVEALYADVVRRGHRPGPTSLIKLVLRSISMRYIAVLRLVQYTQAHHARSPQHALLRFVHGRMTVRYGWEIPSAAQVGPGLLIRHLGPVVIHKDAVLGRNVNLTTGVVVGRSFRGPREGVPVIGDNVYIGPGAKVIGAIHIGDDVAIGANAVVTHDVPSGSVVAGIPAKVISQQGSEGYVERRS